MSSSNGLSKQQTPQRSEKHDHHNHLSPHWGVFIHKQMLFYSLFCAIIIINNRAQGGVASI